MLKETTPLLLTGACASTVLPSVKVTWPVGAAELCGIAATVAVKVMDLPGADGFAEEVTVVFDALEWTNWTSDELPPLKVPSPL